MRASSVRFALRLVIVVSVGFALVIGPGEERVRMIAMF